VSRRLRVLIVDDEESILELLEYNLRKEGMEVVRAPDGRHALLEAFSQEFHLIILDLMLPDMDGLEVCRHLRQETKTQNIPIIMLTARSEIGDRINGLDTGADDYVVKPFSTQELLARVRAILRRWERKDSTGPIAIGNLEIDETRFLVKIAGQRANLTNKEFNLLLFLVKNRGRVMKRDEILDEVWGYDYFGASRTVDVHIRRMRSKLEGMQPPLITVRGVGYKIEE